MKILAAAFALAWCSVAAIAQTPDGYNMSPGQAMAALRTRPDVKFTEQNGWTIASDPPNRTVWSFVPPGHPAYPAAVRRQVVQRGDDVLMDTRVLCGGTKPVCDALVREFQQMTAALRRDAR